MTRFILGMTGQSMGYRHFRPWLCLGLSSEMLSAALDGLRSGIKSVADLLDDLRIERALLQS